MSKLFVFTVSLIALMWAMAFAVCYILPEDILPGDAIEQKISLSQLSSEKNISKYNLTIAKDAGEKKRCGITIKI